MAELPVVTNEIKVSLSKDGTTFIDLIEATTINHSGSRETVEYDTIGSKATRRVITGGVKNDYSFEGKIVVDMTDGSFYKTLRDVYAGTDLGNGYTVKLIEPHSTDPTKVGETRTIKGVIDVTKFDGQAALDLAEFTIDFKSSELPVIVDEEA